MIDLMVQMSLPAPAAGTKLGIDRFVGTDRALEPLARGGRLYVVTLTQPPERIWLVAILEQPVFDGKQWTAAASEIPATDITALRSQLTFATGKGWEHWCESCQQTHWYGSNPQTLTAADAALLDNAAGIAVREIPPAPIAMAPGLHRGALLEAILENPASDEARKIYADQLLAENDLRGEYILVDIALAGPLSIRNRAKLVARRAHLLAGYSAIWWPYALKRYETQKGFLRAVHGTWSQLATIASRLFASEPVTEVGIEKLEPGQLTALLEAPWLARLERLIVRGLDDAGFATLATSPRIANLQALNVSNNNLRAAAFSDIAAALPRVQNLVLSGNPLDDDGLEALRAWEQLANVHTLYLSSCELGAAGIDSLLSMELPNLRTLVLSHNSFGDEAAGVLAQHAARLPALEYLELKNCALSSAGAEAVASARLPKLRRLDVRRNTVDRDLARDERIRV